MAETTSSIGIGVDVGSQGVRVVAATGDGRIMDQAQTAWTLPKAANGRHEQDPRDWWIATCRALRRLSETLNAADRANVAGISVTSTSGTIVVADAALVPVYPALMWDDMRATEEAETCNEYGAETCDKLGFRFRATFGLPKILWLKRNEPSAWKRSTYIAHAADWLSSQLTHQSPISDPTNAFKSGYDVVDNSWPTFIEDLGIDRQMLPDVVPAGTIIGSLAPEVSENLGLSSRTPVIVGMTDANTAQVSGGAFKVGQWVTTIGTGLSVKGVSKHLIRDPLGHLYSHRHPDGHWIPSGTSRSGAGVIAHHFPDSDLLALTRAAEKAGPSNVILYPLPSPGEYFPVWSPTISAFTVGTVPDQAVGFRAHLEGIAYVERLAFEVIDRLGAHRMGPITTLGGGSRSSLWRQIRADVMGSPVRTVVNPETAFGAAIVALCGQQRSIGDIAAQAVRYRDVSEPGADYGHYQEGYWRFKSELVAREFLSPSYLGSGKNG